MKKIIQASFVLLLIGGFLFFTQISCQKSVAQTNGSQTVAQANLILLEKSVQVAGTPITDSGRTIPTTVYTYQFYIADINGSNQRQIPITLPSGLYAGQQGYLTPNGQTLVFTATNQARTVYGVYSCTIDGNNLKKLMDTDNQTQLLGAY